MLSAHEVVKRHLATLVFDAWELPAPLARVVFRALLTAETARARTLRQHFVLAGAVRVDKAHLLHQILTPSFIMQVFDDLAAAGVLSRPVASQVQDHILGSVNTRGEWKHRS